VTAPAVARVSGHPWSPVSCTFPRVLDSGARTRENAQSPGNHGHFLRFWANVPNFPSRPDVLPAFCQDGFGAATVGSWLHSPITPPCPQHSTPLPGPREQRSHPHVLRRAARVQPTWATRNCRWSNMPFARSTPARHLQDPSSTRHSIITVTKTETASGPRSGLPAQRAFPPFFSAHFFPAVLLC
jgi:hypothetical protein